jgi:hypothetical protein
MASALNAKRVPRVRVAKAARGLWEPPAPIEDPLTAPALKPALTETEQKELEQPEAVIKSGWKPFLEVGSALAQVRDKKLYRDKYGSFDEYWRKELG